MKRLGQHLSLALYLLIPIAVGLAATAHAQIRAYVANESDTVSVIDIATNSVAVTIPVGPIPFAPIGIAVTPDGTRVYVTKAGDPFDVASGTVAVIDTATNTVVATIPVGILPEAVAITPDGTRAYVANTASSTASVIDIATNTVIATVAGLLDPLGVAITPDGTRAYVTNEGSGSVSVIDTATNTVVATIPVEIFPVAVAITPDGTRAYVTNEGNLNIPDSGTVSVIDTTTNTVVATIPVGGHPVAVAITPAPRAPTSREQCKHGGYRSFGPPAGPFKNQGQCVSYVEHH